MGAATSSQQLLPRLITRLCPNSRESLLCPPGAEAAVDRDGYEVRLDYLTPASAQLSAGPVVFGRVGAGLLGRGERIRRGVER